MRRWEPDDWGMFAVMVGIGTVFAGFGVLIAAIGIGYATGTIH